MAVFRRLFALAFVCLASLGVAQLPDQQVAARVLGPRWKELSRSAGMVFSGTVLSVETQPAGKDRPLPLISTKFRVDRAIAGVRSGQVLTVREWAGAWPLHRAMRGGQRLLIFLYPPSRLGLTSPVGGPLGQVVLDSRGEIVRTSAAEAGLDSEVFAARLKSCPPENLIGVGGFPAYGVFPQAQCLGENSVAALKRWAKLEHPSGAGFSESLFASMVRERVLSPALKHRAKLERPSGAGFSESLFASMVRERVLSPALKHWAKLERPSGAGGSESSFSSLAREQVLSPALKRCSTQNLVFSANCKAQFQNGLNAALKRCSTQGPTLLAECIDATQSIVTLRQLERAIRSVRRNKE
jgi:hypothetical protein